MKTSHILCMVFFGLLDFISGIQSSILFSEEVDKNTNQHCCEGSLISECSLYKLDKTVLGGDLLSLAPISDKTLDYKGNVGSNSNAYLYQNEYFNVTITKSISSEGVYGQIVSITGQSYVIEYCGGAGQVHSLQKIDVEIEAVGEIFQVPDLGIGTDTIQPSINRFNRNTEEKKERYFSIKFYYTRRFAFETADVNGFINEIISSVEKAFKDSDSSLRPRATCSELADISELENHGDSQIGNQFLIENFRDFKGNVEDLKDGADMAMLLVYDVPDLQSCKKRNKREIGYPKKENCAQYYHNGRENGYMLSVVQKSCVVGKFEALRAIGQNIGLLSTDYSTIEITEGDPLATIMHVGSSSQALLPRIAQYSMENVKRLETYAETLPDYTELSSALNYCHNGLSPWGPWGDVVLMEDYMKHQEVDSERISKLSSLEKENGELKKVINAIKIVKGFETIAERPECHNYYTLSESSRSVNHKNQYTIGDSFFVDTKKNQSTSASWKGNGWYRIAQPAGNRIPEESPWRGCGAEYPGWMDEKHPTEINQSKDVTFCFHLGSDHCWLKIEGKVTHCGSYYVYFLKQSGFGAWRYCAEVGPLV